VSDTHNWRFQKLTLEGKPVWVKGTAGRSLGRFVRPRGIRTGPDGIIYVVDGGTDLVQMFGPDGQLLMRFGGPGNMPGAMGLPSQVAVDATSLPWFKDYIHKEFKAEYLVFAVNQYGTHLVNVYAFGSFPEGFKLSESAFGELPKIPVEEGLTPIGDDADVPEFPPAPTTHPATTQEQDDGQG
jgi:hypothetical protein